ncbi:MAG: hypothetical protein AB1442_09285 [Nitrospirota bacterium]
MPDNALRFKPMIVCWIEEDRGYTKKGGRPMCSVPASQERALITARFPFNESFTNGTPHHDCRHAVGVYVLIGHVVYELLNAKRVVTIPALLFIDNRHGYKGFVHVYIVLHIFSLLLYLYKIIKNFVNRKIKRASDAASDVETWKGQ